MHPEMNRLRHSLLGLASAIVTVWLVTCVAAPGLASAKDGPRLNKVQVDQIRKVIEQQGTKIPVPPPIATGLGLSARQIEPTIRQATFIDPEGVKHGFAELNDGSGYFLFRRSKKDGLAIFHCDREFNLVRAIREFETNQFLELSDADAKVEWTNEIEAWARVVMQRGAKAPTLTQPLQVPAAPPAPASSTK
jgi:hypothetical protein